ncbi:hypothetical protein MMC18_006919 [Xylographa bjoerkii]|nr:hypothetical protein [Xylographa bjoerkii]
MAEAEDSPAGSHWTSANKAEFNSWYGSFQATAYVHPQAASTSPPARRFVRPRAYSLSDRHRPCHVSGPSPPFALIVASYESRFGRPSPPLHCLPLVAAATAAPTPAPATSRVARQAQPYVSGAYAPTTAPDREFFARGPPSFPPGYNHYQVSDELRNSWYTGAGGSTERTQDR